MQLSVIDVSEHQGNIDWEKVEMRIKQYRNSSRIYLRDAIEKGVSRCQ